jgi:peptide/nickel transport system permease protein
MGTLFILFFAITFRWLPSGGTNPASWNQGPAYVPSLLAQIPVRLEYLFLPALTLTLFSYGTFVLLTRATMTEALSEDYIMTARAKGLPERIVLMRHAFKNASLPIITATALTFGGILGGAIITETVFNWWGLGLWLFDSVVNNDYPVMQALFYLIALSTIGANLVADIIYGIVDPRIRYE